MINPAIRHQTFVQRYAGGVTKEILALLRKLDRQVQNSVQGIESRTASATIAQIAGIYAEAGDELKASLSTALVEFAQYEGEFQSRLLAAVTVASTVNTPTAAVLAALVDRSAL